MPAVQNFSGDDLILVPRDRGAGFIGSNVMVDLTNAGDVLLSSTFPGRARSGAISPRLSCTCPDVLFEWLGHRGDRLAAIVHMGAISSTTENDVDKFVATNTRLSLDLW